MLINNKLGINQLSELQRDSQQYIGVVDQQCTGVIDPQYPGDSVINSQCVGVTDPQYIGDIVTNSVSVTDP